MHMAGYRYLVFILLFIVASCAQVGVITGGGQDLSAPEPIKKRASPINGATNFSGTHVEIPFNEFFKLKNPANNIVMVPPHAKINATFKGKTLRLDWTDTLQKNTTYAIYLNHALQDLNESNDSMIQYVFSTGDILDSLSYRIQVKNAWTNKPVAKAMVILRDKFTQKLVSFSSTNSRGFAEMNYLRAGEYTISAFQDLNADMEYQNHEPIAFSLNDQVVLLKSHVDSIPYRLYAPVLEPKITTKKFVGPNSFIVAANRSLLNTEFTINETPIEESKRIYHTADSVQLFWNATGTTNVGITVQNAFFDDTLFLRYSENTTNSPLRLTSISKSNAYAPTDTVGFLLNDLILSADTSLIQIQNLVDSTFVNDHTLSVYKDKLHLLFDKTGLSRLLITFNPNAIHSINDSLNSTEFIVTLSPDHRYGAIDLNLNYYQCPIVVKAFKDGGVSQEFPIGSPSESFKLTELAPGKYTFIVIADLNGNGKWDVGDYATRKQPETLDVFSTPIRVRANWEVAVELIPAE
jgi:uncharacterized protein (DUF2141 family)